VVVNDVAEFSDAMDDEQLQEIARHHQENSCSPDDSTAAWLTPGLIATPMLDVKASCAR